MKQKTALGILKAGQNVFLTGSAGTGKTYLLNQYIDYLKERGVKPAIVAPTGIAASHLGGITIHSFFGIGIMEAVSDEYLKQLYYRRFLHNRFEKLQVLVVDEVSMVSPELFISMNKILRMFKHSSEPFGGIQLILSGDFFQLPPVSNNREPERFVWQTDLWEKSNLKICYLEERFRQNDQTLISILDEIRANNVSEKSINILHTCYRKKLSDKFQITRLYTHNIDVDRINENELNKLPGNPRIFQSRNKGSRKNIEKVFNSSLVMKELKLKKGAVVIFIKNNFEKGYINGTLGQLVNFTKENLPVVETFSGRRIVVEPEDWLIEDDQGNIKASVKQIPLRLAWAVTIHKSQGMTLDAAEIDLSKTFEAGQGYVALSRIKSIDGLCLMGLNKTALQVDERVLAVDKKMQELSDLNASQWQSFSQKERETMQKEFILNIGGTINKKEIKKHKKIVNKKKERKEFFGRSRIQQGKNYETLNITRNLLAERKSIAEIADVRGLSEETIISHIQRMVKLGLDIDIEKDHLKPEEKILEAVARAISEIKKRNNPDDFLENGQMRLRAIFEKLNQEISYNNIRLALLFLKS